MANLIATLTMITREALMVLHNNLGFAKGVNRQYSAEFAQTGAKIGTTLNVRQPNRYFVSEGPVITIQNTTETYVPVTLQKQYNVAVNFTSQDLTCSMDDISKRILTPAMAKIASRIDQDGLALAKQIYNNVGTPGYTPGANQGTGIATVNSPQIFLNAGVLLDNSAAPRDESRRVILNPLAQGGTVAGLSGLFQASESLAEQYRKGVMGSAFGFEFCMDQNVNTLTCGNRAATALVSGSNQTGASLIVSGLGANATVSAGEKFYLSGVDSVNPENQMDTGLPQQFVVLTATTANSTGYATLSISPSIVVAASNVANGTVTAAPSGGATLTWYGTASTTYPMSLAYHQDAFTLATADLILPGGTDMAAREVYDGISMRVVRQYDITNDTLPLRIDVLAGWACLRPEFATVLWG
jgi:hypothetical protein